MGFWDGLGCFGVGGFVLIGLWCGLECSYKVWVFPLLVVVSGGGFGYSFFFGGGWILGGRFVGVFNFRVLLTHGDVRLDHVYGLLGCGLF